MFAYDLRVKCVSLVVDVDVQYEQASARLGLHRHRSLWGCQNEL